MRATSKHARSPGRERGAVSPDTPGSPVAHCSPFVTAAAEVPSSRVIRKAPTPDPARLFAQVEPMLADAVAVTSAGRPSASARIPVVLPVTVAATDNWSNTSTGRADARYAASVVVSNCTLNVASACATAARADSSSSTARSHASDWVPSALSSTTGSNAVTVVAPMTNRAVPARYARPSPSADRTTALSRRRYSDELPCNVHVVTPPSVTPLGHPVVMVEPTAAGVALHAVRATSASLLVIDAFDDPHCRSPPSVGLKPV